MSKIYNPSGGYRKLHSFNFATIIHLGTMSFCKRYLPWKDDPLGKTLGQMIGASRSGKQNIIEGSERAKTSSETEIKLTDVGSGEGAKPERTNKDQRKDQCLECAQQVIASPR